MTARTCDDPSSSPLEVVRKCFAAWSAGDLTSVIDHMSDDCIYDLHVPTDVLPYGGQHEGKAAILDALRSIRAEFHFLVWEMNGLRQDGDIVRGQIIFYFKDRATGEIMDGRSRHLSRVIGGKIVSIDEFHDVEKLRAFVALARSYKF